METNQHLLGEGVALSIPQNLNGNGSPTNLVVAGTKPVLTLAAGDMFTIGAAMPVEIRGLSMTASAGNVVDVTTAAALSGSAMLTVGDNTIGGAGAEGIDVNLNASTTGTLTLAVANNTWNGAGTHTGNAIDITNASGVASSLRINISNNVNVKSNANRVLISGGNVANTTITHFANNSILGGAGAAGVSINAVTFDETPGGAAQPVQGGTLAIGVSGTPVGGAGLIATNSAGNLSFEDLDVYSAAGAGLQLSGTGSFTFSVRPAAPVDSGTSVIDADNGPAVDVTGVALDLRLSDLDSNTSTSGVTLTTVSGFFGGASGSQITKASGTGAAFSVNNSAVGTTVLSSAYSGTINNSSGTGRSVLVNTADNGSTLTFSGQVSDTGQGISLTTNTGATITFRGGLNVSTGGNAAFSATGGGTINVCDENPCNPTATGALLNTLTTTTGTALNVANTTIGNNDIEFRSISADGAANGIVLNTTGSSGGLTLTGSGNTSPGGNSSGGTIQNTSGDGILLTDTRDVSLNNMNIQSTTGQGVNGTRVVNFAFTYGTVNNSGTVGVANTSNLGFNTVSSVNENNLSGTVTITNNILTNAAFHGIDIFNFAGTISDAVISNNTITSSTSTATSKGSGIRLLAKDSPSTIANVTKATIDGNTISNFPSGAGIVAQGDHVSSPGTFGTAGHATNKINISNNRIAGASAAVKMSINAIQAVINGQGQGNFSIVNNGTPANPITNITGNKIVVSAIGEVTVTANVDNNFISANDTAGVGGALGISAGADSLVPGCVQPAGGNCDSPNFTLSVEGNTISGTDASGIFIRSVNNLGILELFLNNNNVGAPLSGFREGIQVHAGSSATDQSDTTVCLKATNNTSAGSGGADGMGLRKQGTNATIHAFGIDGLSGGVELYLDGLNPGLADGLLDGDTLGVTLISATSGFTSCTYTP